MLELIFLLILVDLLLMGHLSFLLRKIFHLHNYLIEIFYCICLLNLLAQFEFLVELVVVLKNHLNNLELLIFLNIYFEVCH